MTCSNKSTTTIEAWEFHLVSSRSRRDKFHKSGHPDSNLRNL